MDIKIKTNKNKATKAAAPSSQQQKQQQQQWRKSIKIFIIEELTLKFENVIVTCFYLVWNSIFFSFVCLDCVTFSKPISMNTRRVSIFFDEMISLPQQISVNYVSTKLD